MYKRIKVIELWYEKELTGVNSNLFFILHRYTVFSISDHKSHWQGAINLKPICTKKKC